MDEVKGEPQRQRRPATTPEEQENRLIALAAEEAERQLRAGTASAQLVTQLLKFGSARERLERERIQHENELLKVKREQIASQARIEEMYMDALNAMRSYRGDQPAELPDDEFED